MKKAMLQLHLAIFLAGFTAVLGRLISLGAPALIWWRVLITVTLMFLLMAFRPKRQYKPALVRKTMMVGAILGLHWLCFFGSVKLANVSIALVCFSSAGFFSACLEPLINRRRVSIVELTLGLLSMSGIYIIFQFDPRFKAGIALGVAGGALSSLFSIFNKKLVPLIDDFSLTFWEMLGAFIVSCIFLPFAIWDGSAFFPNSMDWVWLGILATLCTIWAFLLHLQALHHISAFTLNLSYNLEPVYGILLAFVIFKENRNLNFAFYIGLFLIILAISIQMLIVKRERKPVAIA